MTRTILTTALALTLVLVGTAYAGHGPHSAKADKAAKAAQAENRCPDGLETCLTKRVAEYRARGWFGIKTEKVGDGYHAQVTEVISGSPAEAAGLEVGDVLVALNGVELTAGNKAALKKVKKNLRAGTTATYTVERRGARQQVAVTLGEVPAEVMATWLGYHMLESHAPVRVAAVD